MKNEEFIVKMSADEAPTFPDGEIKQHDLNFYKTRCEELTLLLGNYRLTVQQLTQRCDEKDRLIARLKLQLKAKEQEANKQ